MVMNSELPFDPPPRGYIPYEEYRVKASKASYRWEFWGEKALSIAVDYARIRAEKKAKNSPVKVHTDELPVSPVCTRKAKTPVNLDNE